MMKRSNQNEHGEAITSWRSLKVDTSLRRQKVSDTLQIILDKIHESLTVPLLNASVAQHYDANYCTCIIFLDNNCNAFVRFVKS